MIEAIHKHLLSELDRAGRSDIVFVICGVLFNLLVLFVNWVQASSLSNGRGNFAIFLIFTAGTLVVSGAALLVLMNSRKICIQCHGALQRLYQDANVAQYMPPEMAALGDKRFYLSFAVVAGTGALAVTIPFLSLME